VNVGKTKIKDLAVASEFPQLFGIGDFQPSLLQCKALIAWIDSPEADSPSATIKKLGHDYHNWYVWQKQPGFADWWNECIERSFKASDLMKLYKALLKRGLSNDTAAGKIFIQRFDSKFTERSSGDTRHTFEGFTPTDPASTEEAIERSRKRVESQAADSVEPEPIELEPAIEQPVEPVEPDFRKRLRKINQESRERIRAIKAERTASDARPHDSRLHDSTQHSIEHIAQLHPDTGKRIPDKHTDTHARENDDPPGGGGAGAGVI